MKIKELPIYWDLINLPPAVVISRLRKRLGPKKTTSQPAQTGSTRLGRLPLSAMPAGVLEAEKWEELWQNYRHHRMNLLGSGWISLLNKEATPGFLHYQFGRFPRPGLAADAIDWNRDQRSGFQFDPALSPRQAMHLAFSTEGVDVKFSWEFARFHHFPQLAVIAQGEPQKAEEAAYIFKLHWQSFRDQCPYNTGIHWGSPMEVAIRLSNVLIAYDLLRDHLPELEAELATWAYQHWHFINQHLEHKDGLGTNHYLSNLMGLLVAGFYLEDEEVKNKAQWACQEFLREQRKQFFADGFNFEYSSYYHRLSTEICLLSLYFASCSGFELPAENLKLLAKSICLIQLLSKSNAEMPAFGDNDSGRILSLNPQGRMSANGFSPRPDHCGFVQELFKAGSLYHWFYQTLLPLLPPVEVEAEAGSRGGGSWTKPSYQSQWRIEHAKIQPGSLRSFYLADAGIVLFKDQRYFLAINLMANPLGHRYRGHQHNDKGSFELRVDDEDLVQDPAVLSYTASVELRNRYRNTTVHHLPYTGIEQNRYFDGALGLFHSRLDVQAELLELNARGCVCRIRYRGVEHLRQFEIFDDHLLVSDFCNRPFKLIKNPEIKVARGYGNIDEESPDH